MPGFKERLEWYLANRPDLASLISRWQEPGVGERRLIALTRGHRMKCLLRRMLIQTSFLSHYGIRSLSAITTQPIPMFCGRRWRRNTGCPLPAGESDIGYVSAATPTGAARSGCRSMSLLVRALLNLYSFYGDEFKIQCPTGSGRYMTLFEVAQEISRRLASTFLRDAQDRQRRRPVYGGTAKFQDDPHWRDLILFYEYFHGDNGAGLGASHQTGWTGLVAAPSRPVRASRRQRPGARSRATIGPAREGAGAVANGRKGSKDEIWSPLAIPRSTKSIRASG